MLRTCQSRIAFSKSKWYASAINTVFKPILLAHSRRSSSAVAVLEDTSLPEQQVQQGNDELVKVPMDNYRRCDGFRVYDGGRCQRLVRAAGAEPVFCYNHHPERQSKAVSKKKRKSPELKRILPTALLRTPENNRLVKGSSIFKTPNKLFDCSHCK